MSTPTNPLYTQTSEQDDYLKLVAGIGPARLQAMVLAYKSDRAMVLGLPVGNIVNGPQGPQFQPANTTRLKLAERLATLGPRFGLMLADNNDLKELIEEKANKAIASLGGRSAIRSNGVWGFLLEDIQQDGQFVLPGLTFTTTTPASPGTPGVVYDVVITVNEQTGVGTVTYTAIGGGQSNTDPL